MNYGKAARYSSLFVTILAILAPLSAGAFGISPPSITADRLLKGSRYQGTVVLVRADAKEPLGVNTIINVPDKIRPWITLSSGENFIIPVGVQQFPVSVLVQIPQDADLGIYKGSIDFNSVPIRKAGDQVVIAVGVSLSMNFVVGEGVFSDFKVKHLDILDIREGEAPQVVATIENLGNVPVAPERATFDLFDRYGEVRLAFAQTTTFDEIPPFETSRLVASFPIDFRLGIGEYWAEAKIYKDGTVAGELKTVFNVTEGKGLPIMYGIYILAGVLVLAGFFIGRKKLKKKLLR